MKRFWTDVAVCAQTDGHVIRLDGRPLRTPRRQPLVVPTLVLAAAIADEWRAVDGAIRPGSLPLTGIANAAIDIVTPDPAAFAAELARYAETDLTCYRADGPEPLVARQVAAWEPPLQALEARHGLEFRRTAGITPVHQPPATLEAIAGLLLGLDAFRLAALQPIVSISGSLVLALALLDGTMDAEACFTVGNLDEIWQEEQWGTDALAQAARAARRADFAAAARFLTLLDAGGSA